MKNLRLNYDVLITVSRSLSKSKDPDEIIRMTVESLKKALAIKGCSLFLMNNQNVLIYPEQINNLLITYCVLC